MKDGNNWYSYVNGDPINNSDPSGYAPARIEPRREARPPTSTIMGCLLDKLKKMLPFMEPTYNRFTCLARCNYRPNQEQAVPLAWRRQVLEGMKEKQELPLWRMPKPNSQVIVVAITDIVTRYGVGEAKMCKGYTLIYSKFDEIYLHLNNYDVDFEFCIQLFRNLRQDDRYRIKLLALDSYRLFPPPSWDDEGKEIPSDPADEMLWTDRSTWLNRQDISATTVSLAKKQALDILSDYFLAPFGEEPIEFLREYWSL